MSYKLPELRKTEEWPGLPGREQSPKRLAWKERLSQLPVGEIYEWTIKSRGHYKSPRAAAGSDVGMIKLAAKELGLRVRTAIRTNDDGSATARVSRET